MPACLPACQGKSLLLTVMGDLSYRLSRMVTDWLSRKITLIDSQGMSVLLAGPERAPISLSPTGDHNGIASKLSPYASKNTPPTRHACIQDRSRDSSPHTRQATLPALLPSWGPLASRLPSNRPVQRVCFFLLPTRPACIRDGSRASSLPLSLSLSLSISDPFSTAFELWFSRFETTIDHRTASVLFPAADTDWLPPRRVPSEFHSLSHISVPCGTASELGFPSFVALIDQARPASVRLLTADTAWLATRRVASELPSVLRPPSTLPVLPPSLGSIAPRHPLTRLVELACFFPTPNRPGWFPDGSRASATLSVAQRHC